MMESVTFHGVMPAKTKDGDVFKYCVLSTIGTLNTNDVGVLQTQNIPPVHLADLNRTKDQFNQLKWTALNSLLFLL